MATKRTHTRVDANSTLIERPKDTLTPKIKCLMQEFWDRPHGWSMPLSRAVVIWQGTLKAVLNREYIELNGSGLRCTKVGWYIKTRYDEATIEKSDTSRNYGEFAPSVVTLTNLSGNFLPASRRLTRHSKKLHKVA